jgi:hypothetical protein
VPVESTAGEKEGKRRKVSCVVRGSESVVETYQSEAAMAEAAMLLAE